MTIPSKPNNVHFINFYESSIVVSYYTWCGHEDVAAPHRVPHWDIRYIALFLREGHIYRLTWMC